MRICRGIRWENNFDEEVEFSKSIGFECMQIWFYKGELNINSEDKLEAIKNADHDIIIHAVWTPNEIEDDSDKLIQILLELGHRRLILHPVLEEERTKESILDLEKALLSLVDKLDKNNIRLYVENNSMIDDINHRLDDMRIIYKHDKIQLLLDVAHISSYDHLEKILKIRQPSMLHLADKRFHIPHEHLPLGQGELDFDLIFKTYLSDFDGDIILEITGSDQDLSDSYNKLNKIIK